MALGQRAPIEPAPTSTRPCVVWVTTTALNRIHGALDDSPIPYTFSLVIANERLDEPIRAHIERVGVVFYARQQAPVLKS